MGAVGVALRLLQRRRHVAEMGEGHEANSSNQRNRQGDSDNDLPRPVLNRRK
jgi:hypothetical protein